MNTHRYTYTGSRDVAITCGNCGKIFWMSVEWCECVAMNVVCCAFCNAAVKIPLEHPDAGRRNAEA